MPWPPPLLLASSAPPACAVTPRSRLLGDQNARPARSRSRARCRPVAIAAAAAFGPRVAAAAGELLAKVAPIVDVPPVASLVRRTDRPMKDGPTAQWPPAGLGTEVTFPPDTLNKAERGLWVPMRSKHAWLAISMMSDTCQGLKDGSQCTGAVSRDSDAMRKRGEGVRIKVRGGWGFEPSALPASKTGAAVGP